MGECKAKAIQIILATFRHILAYLEPCVTLKYFITLVYPEP